MNEYFYLLHHVTFHSVIADTVFFAKPLPKSKDSHYFSVTYLNTVSKIFLK